MKKTIKFFAAALAIVVASACAKEDYDYSTRPLVHKVFTAKLDINETTKTVLHTDGITVHWTEDDAIRIAPANSASWSDNFAASSVNGTFATFEGEVTEANKYWAVYPAQAVNTTNNYGGYYGWKTDKSTIVLSGPTTSLATQYAVDNNFSICGEFKTSSNFAISVSSSNTNSLDFKNINAYIKFNLATDNAKTIELSSDAVTTVPQGELAVSTDCELGGPIILNFNNEAAVNAWKNGIPHPGIYSSSEIINFSYENGVNLKSGVNYYIAIPAVDIDGFKLVVKDANGKTLQSLKKSKRLNVEPNTIYDLGTIEVAPVPVPKVGDYFYSDGTFSTNLDTDKTVVGVIFALTDATSTDPNLAKDYPHCINGLVLGSMEQYSNFGDHTKDDFNSGSTYKYFSTNGWPLTPRDDAEQKIMGYTHTLALKGYREFRGGNYANLVTVLNGLRVLDNCSPWYIPSFAEMKLLKENANIINNKMGNIGNVLQTNAYYWPSTLMKGPSYNDHITQPFNMSTGTWKDASDKWDNEKTKSYPVRVIFAF